MNIYQAMIKQRRKKSIFALTWLVSSHIAMHVCPLIENGEVAISTIGYIIICTIN